MKLLPALVLALVFALSELASAQSVSQVYSEAQRAYIAGDLDTAKEKFRMVLAVNPRHQPSINYLRLIETNEKQGGAAKQQAKTLSSLIIPEISFRDATLGSALDLISQVARTESGGAANVNLVRQLPEGYEDETKITLELKNTPFTTVLRYVGDLGRVTFKIEPYAIVVKPKENTVSTPATQE